VQAGVPHGNLKLFAIAAPYLERCLGKKPLVGHFRTASMSRPPSIGVKDVLADTSTLARDVVLSGRYEFSMF
jgi:hypothetical protein